MIYSSWYFGVRFLLPCPQFERGKTFSYTELERRISCLGEYRNKLYIKGSTKKHVNATIQYFKFLLTNRKRCLEECEGILSNLTILNKDVIDIIITKYVADDSVYIDLEDFYKWCGGKKFE